MYRVIVTFIEEWELSDNSERDFSAQTQGGDFWNDEREAIYQDFFPACH